MISVSRGLTTHRAIEFVDPTRQLHMGQTSRTTMDEVHEGMNQTPTLTGISAPKTPTSTGIRVFNDDTKYFGLTYWTKKWKNDAYLTQPTKS